MANIKALCERVIVIHQGRILFDGALALLVERFSADKKQVIEHVFDAPTEAGRSV